MSLINFFIKELDNEYLRENFRKLSSFFQSSAWLNSRFQHLELTYSTNGTFKANHTLGAKPRDIIQTSKVGTGSISYNYANFTKDTVEVTTTGTDSTDPLVVRLFIGTYNND